MTDETIDLLQIKIEKAKAGLSPETISAIATVDWKAAILGLRATKGYNFEQLGDLELETELLLCGLLNPADYPKELENRMKISGAEANELAKEMNDLVFKKIREELIKNTGRKNIFENKTNMVEEKKGVDILKSAGIEIMPNLSTTAELPSASAPSVITMPSREEMLKKIEKPEVIIKPEIQSTLGQKISKPLQIPMVKTEYTLDNLSKNTNSVPQAPKDYSKTKDPYRLSPND
jgi:hypothetical protein